MRNVKPEGNPSSFVAMIISPLSVILTILVGVCCFGATLPLGAPITAGLFGFLGNMLILLGVARVAYHFKNTTGK
jgi:hypothetical protein